MDASGSIPGLFPTLYGAPYTDYPVSYTALTHFISRLSGGLSTFALTFPVAVAMALSVAGVYLTGSLLSRRLGLCAGLLSLCTLGVINGGRAASIDGFVCLASVACFLLASLSFSGGLGRRVLCFAAAMAFVVFAFLMRGPIGAVVASASFIACFAGGLEWRRAFAAAVVCGAVFALCSAAFFYFSWLQGGEPLLKSVVSSQVGGRLTGSGKPFYFYFANGLGEYAAVFPLALAALFFARKGVWRRGSQEELRFFGRAIAWGLVVVLGLSVPSTKHLRYILPAAPGFALAAACLLCHPSLFSLPSWAAKAVSWLSLKKLLAAAALLCALVVFVVERLEVKFEESRTFVNAAISGSTDRERVVFYQLGPDGEELKFLCNAGGRVKPSFVSDPKDLPRDGRTVVTLKKAFEALPPELKAKAWLIASGDLGHKRATAFVLERP